MQGSLRTLLDSQVTSPWLVYGRPGVCCRSQPVSRDEVVPVPTTPATTPPLLAWLARRDAYPASAWLCPSRLVSLGAAPAHRWRALPFEGNTQRRTPRGTAELARPLSRSGLAWSSAHPIRRAHRARHAVCDRLRRGIAPRSLFQSCPCTFRLRIWGSRPLLYRANPLTSDVICNKLTGLR